jgi:hypothetical protein
MSIESYKEDYMRAFVPDEYLADYYAEGPDTDVDFIVSFIARLGKELRLSKLSVLELGGGPALYSTAAYVPFAKEIHFSDYLPANLSTVSSWVQNALGAFDWSAFVALVLEREGIPATKDAIAERTSDMRRLVTRVIECDVLSSDPVPGGFNSYDLVSALYCTDIASSTVKEW